MKKITLFFLIIFLAGCHNQTENAGIENGRLSEDTTSYISSEIKEEEIISETSTTVEMPLYLAQCSEPFMAAYFFKHKIRLIFPEKTDSVLNIKSSINWDTDFEGSYSTVNNLNIRLSVKNKSCTHPGSGEIWEKMVTFVISNREYKGCMKKLN